MSNLSNWTKPFRFSTYSILLIMLIILLSERAVPANDTSFVRGALTNSDTREYNISILVAVRGGLGSYKNLTMQKSDSDSLVIKGSFTGLLHLEFGVKFQILGVTYYCDYVATRDFLYTDVPGYRKGAGYTRKGIRSFCEILHKSFHFAPEVGYVFLNEDAIISDSEGKKPDLLREEYKDENYNYGLSGRVKLIPISKVGLWLYARYIHDNLNIQADNYSIEIQVGGINQEPTGLQKSEPYLESGYLTLGVHWARKTDGRSEWFLTLGISGSLGLL